jgi:2'-5' RNA ligase
MTEAIWRLFPRDHRFDLVRKGRSSIRFWGKRREIVAMEFTPSSDLLILNALVAAIFTPEIKDPLRFKPHFTLVNPYPHSPQSAFVRALSQTVEGVSNIRIESICLAVQWLKGKPWEIYREFRH